jgi:hypothetical protein
VIYSQKMSMMIFRKACTRTFDPGVGPSSDQVRGHAFRHHALTALRTGAAV